MNSQLEEDDVDRLWRILQAHRAKVRPVEILTPTLKDTLCVRLLFEAGTAGNEAQFKRELSEGLVDWAKTRSDDQLLYLLDLHSP